jgi:hypothetical protein
LGACPPANAGGHRAIRSNLFACGKKYFRFYRIALPKIRILRILGLHSLAKQKYCYI